MYNVYVCDSSLRNVITVFEGIAELCITLCLNSYCKTHNHNDKRVETKNLKMVFFTFVLNHSLEVLFFPLTL